MVATMAARTAPDPEALLQAEQLLLAGRYEETALLLEPHLSADSPSGRTELLYALSQHKQKRYARARPWFDAARKAPGDWAGRDSCPYYLGWCLYNLGELDGAEESFAEHLELLPTEGDSWFGMGLVASDRGDLELAAERFSSAIELNAAAVNAGRTQLAADLAKSYARLGETERLRDRPEAARDALLNCVRVHPGHTTAWYQLHEVLLELGEDSAAADALVAYEQSKQSGS